MARFAAVFLLVLTVPGLGVASGTTVPLPAGSHTRHAKHGWSRSSTAARSCSMTERRSGSPASTCRSARAPMPPPAWSRWRRRHGRRSPIWFKVVGSAWRSGDTPRDRYGRLRGHLVRRDDGTWIQGALLAAGLARVHSLVDDRAAVTAMLAIEHRARSARLGIWSRPHYRVLAARQSRYGASQLPAGRGAGSGGGGGAGARLPQLRRRLA